VNVFIQSDPGVGPPRSHPWTEATADPAFRYYDLRAHPELIATELEDFRPWEDFAAVRSFYRLLAWLNGPGSTLETNDCAFNAPDANGDPRFPKRLQASGRVMILFRDLARNLRRSHVEALQQQLLESLTELDPGFPWTAVATAIAPTRFVSLPPRKQSGHQLAIHFFVWGDTTDEVFENLERVVTCLSEALHQTVAV
jgi:hypothetical protein